MWSQGFMEFSEDLLRGSFTCMALTCRIGHSELGLGFFKKKKRSNVGLPLYELSRDRCELLAVVHFVQGPGSYLELMMNLIDADGAEDELNYDEKW